MSAERFTHDIFLSHSSEDKTLVRAPAEQGVQCIPLRLNGAAIRSDKHNSSASISLNRLNRVFATSAEE